MFITSHLSEWLTSIINKQIPVRIWRKGNPILLLVEMLIGAVTVEGRMVLQQKVKIFKTAL